MLQDLTHGRLENEYRPDPPLEGDFVLCFRRGYVLLRQREDGVFSIPTVSELGAQISRDQLRYAFRLDGCGWFLCMEYVDAAGPFLWQPVRELRQSVSKEVCYAAWTGWHLYNWYQNNRFCGSCGTETVHDDIERMLRCPCCGNQIFPRIAPAVIVGVTDGDRLLLSKYAGRGHTSYALIAGYTEIGETIEQTVRREVMEEVGLKVKNLRYYKSQPWGIDGNVLMGFYCDLDGSDAIRLDERELALAEWHHRDALPVGDDGISLTREMIRTFGEGKEPK